MRQETEEMRRVIAAEESTADPAKLQLIKQAWRDRVGGRAGGWVHGVPAGFDIAGVRELGWDCACPALPSPHVSPATAPPSLFRSLLP